MSKTKYYLREKAKPSNLITADWQNASELVSHGFWEWANPDGSKSSGAREFAVAQKEAQTGRAPEGFYDAAPVTVVDADDADEGASDPAPTPEKQEQPTASAPAAVPTAAVPMDLEDMTIEELRDHAAAIGLTVDRRVGTKNLIAQIKNATEK